MTNEEETRAVVTAMERVIDILPEDRDLAFAALAFAIVDVAAEADISREQIHANIEKVLNARLVAARQMMS
ncbi:hypothetical protein [Rhizobium sp. LC145]|uniref:hypothetical protein n=1 Tax=Rhizobium sp. LC145 TaxID=1120688 RepID=UPI00062A22F5|nr:hypothetical protein [Rhizobium sp. LC145]KKX24342.1 hypothetical protein YH62_27740 [Rhizobium sp. LC145]TKT46159.1 hypothetical protein FDR95_23655 [Rhizobiaceae bacterium LC148]